jgi:alpha-L-rhamnosidase
MMKNVRTYVGVLILCLFPATSFGLSQGLELNTLRCEYRVNPLGIDAERPRLSWILEATGDRRMVVQRAYQVLAADSLKKLKADEGNLWDSGKVESEQFVHVRYQGKPLGSGQRVYWKVRIWDEQDEPTVYSKPAWWEMGLLKQEDWQAKWVTVPEAEDEEKRKLPAEGIKGSRYYRRVYTLDQEVERARAYICGLGYYELYINGRKVGDRVLDPAFTAYDKRALYSTYDVSDYLQKGKNCIGVIVGNGWYNMHTEAVWNFNQAPWRDTPQFILQMPVEYKDDSNNEMLVSDESWTVNTGPIVFDCIRNGEVYDARKEVPGFEKACYKMLDWPGVRVVESPTKSLEAQQNPPIRVTEDMKPKSISEPKPGVYVVDMGQNFAGWVKLKAKAPAGTKVDLKYGERLYDNGTVNQEQIAKYVKHPRFQKDTYIFKGEGTEVYEPRFMYHGFRYVEISGLPAKPSLDDITGRVVHTDFPSAGRFECSNELLNKIQEAARWSYRSNFHGYPEDCPHREKNGWTADAHLASGLGMWNFFNVSAYEKWINDFPDVREGPEKRFFPGIVPTAGWGYEWGNGPAWDIAYILIPWGLLNFYGDQDIVEKHYSVMKDYVAYLGTVAEDHIVKYGLGDWVPAKTTTPNELTSTFCYYYDARLLSAMAYQLNKQADARRYADLAQQIKKAFNRTFYDKEKGYYEPGSQTAQACALYGGLVNEDQKEKVLNYLIEDIRKQDYHLDTGVLGAALVLEVLEDEDKVDIVYEIVSRDTYPSWGYWIEQGATTLWEDWKGEASRNHVFFGFVSDTFCNALAGIRLVSGYHAFHRIRIKPGIVKGLDWAKADYDSIAGQISSYWKGKPGDYVLNVTIPAGSAAAVHLPLGEDSRVQEGGYPADMAEGVAFKEYKNGEIIYFVGSGSYEFVVEPE